MTVSGYEQFEMSPEMIGQELRAVVCEQGQSNTDRDRFITLEVRRM